MTTKVKVSLAASSKATKKISDKAVKTAKAILKTAYNQKAKEFNASYKIAVENLELLRKESDKELAKVSANISSLVKEQDKLKASFAKKIEKAISIRDKAAEKAGVIVQPRASSKTVTVQPKSKQSKVKSSKE